MAVRRILGVIAMLFLATAVLAPPSVEARERRCRNDRQCKGGVCNASGRCCDTFAGEVACGYTCCDSLLEGQTCCGNTCANLQNDDANCGSCGNACTGGQFCQQGSCVCPSGTAYCDGVCTFLDSDPSHCGSCVNECRSDQWCDDGYCACPIGQTECALTCVDTQTDRNNCGGCGNVCLAGQDCVAGQCKSAVCDTGQTPCFGGNGSIQCCYGGLVCDGGRCCFPDGALGCPCAGCTGCCSYGN